MKSIKISVKEVKAIYNVLFKNGFFDDYADVDEIKPMIDMYGAFSKDLQDAIDHYHYEVYLKPRMQKMFPET